MFLKDKRTPTIRKPSQDLSHPSMKTITMTAALAPFALLLCITSSSRADLAHFQIPTSRGDNNSAHATFDSFRGLSSINATGTTTPEQSSNLTSVALSQTTPLTFPGGLKFTTATDLRVYTFTAAASWQLSATAAAPFQEVMLQVSELLDTSRVAAGEVLPGLTGYTLSLAGNAPTASRVESYLLDEGTLFERVVEVTTFHWTLAHPATSLTITMDGYRDAHDSIDAFALDLAPAAQPSPLVAPEISLQNGLVTLSWSSPTNAILQRYTRDQNGPAWETVAAPVIVSGGRKLVTLPVSDSALFRLITP